MTTKKLGRQTFALSCPPSVAGWGSVTGSKEGQGPLGDCFGLVSEDSYFGEKTWEKAESAMQRLAVSQALEMAGQPAGSLDALFGGDLNNQCIATGYAARSLKVPVVQTIHNFRLLCPCGTFYREGKICEACAACGSFRPALKHRCYRNPTAR